jgi:hypothetical protein
VEKDGNISSTFQASTNKNDVSGGAVFNSIILNAVSGMKAKVESSIEVALSGVDVFIVMAKSDDAILACRGIKVGWCPIPLTLVASAWNLHTCSEMNKPCIDYSSKTASLSLNSH